MATIQCNVELIKGIAENREWLQTTDNDEIVCISIENLTGILIKYNPELKTYIDMYLNE